MLAEDERKNRQFQRICQPLKLAESVAANIGILWAVGNETVVGQLGRKFVIVVQTLPARFNQILRPSVETVLANHHRPSLTGSDTPRHEQNPVGVDIRPKQNQNLVTE